MIDQPNSLQVFFDRISNAVASGIRNHERAELLSAYRLRHRWKAGDAAPLRTLKLSPIAARRVAKLRGRGRPIVAPHTDALSALAMKILPLFAGLQNTEPRRERLSSIKLSVWWPHFVEAVYRGEYAVAKSDGLKSAAEVTEARIADALCISSAIVRKLCTKVRLLRAGDPEAANFPSARLAGFMEWMNEGREENFPPLIDLLDSSRA